jgi:hypothetical protein
MDVLNKMNQIKWHPTTQGWRAVLLNGDYILDVWQVDHIPSGWFAGVNDRSVNKENGEDKIFCSLDSAKVAAEQLAEEMLRNVR